VVELASVRDPGLVASTVAQALGIREIGDRAPADALRDFLLDKQVLLVLDNFEQVVEAGLLVSDLLGSCPRLKVLTTSRMPLRLRGEHEFPVPPLAVPPPGEPEGAAALAGYSSLELFVDRARVARPDFTISEENAAVVAEICRRLDGLPLAIELAAARLRVLGSSDLLARLRGTLTVLTGGPRDLPERQQTMRNTIEWSYRLLDERGAMLFRRLAAFMGGADLEAVEAVCNADHALGEDVLAELEGLVEENLVQAVAGIDTRPRFRMLETIREYALEGLEHSLERSAIQELHATYFLALATRAEPFLTGGGRGPWLILLEAELDNVRAVLERSLTGAVPFETGLRLMSRMLWFWYLRGRIVEGRTRAEEMLAAADGAEPSSERGKLLMAAGALAWCQGEFVAARVLLEQSVAMLRELGDRSDLAFPLNMLAATLASQHEYSAARGVYQDCLAVARQVGDHWTEAFASSWLGDVYLLMGEPARARRLQEEALEIFGQLGDDWGRAMVLHGLAVVLGSMSDYGTARAMFAESAGLMRAADDGYALARVLTGAAELETAEGDLARGTDLLEEAARLWLDMGNEVGLLLCVGGFARIAALRGDPERATRLLAAAGSPLRTVGSLTAIDDRGYHEELVATLRVRLGEEAWQGETSAGRSLSAREAIAYALAG
jgi:predicted ATPase